MTEIGRKYAYAMPTHRSIIGVYCTLMEKEHGNRYIDTNWKLVSKDNRDNEEEIARTFLKLNTILRIL